MRGVARISRTRQTLTEALLMIPTCDRRVVPRARSPTLKHILESVDKYSWNCEQRLVDVFANDLMILPTTSAYNSETEHRPVKMDTDALRLDSRFRAHGEEVVRKAKKRKLEEVSEHQGPAESDSDAIDGEVASIISGCEEEAARPNGDEANDDQPSSRKNRPLLERVRRQRINAAVEDIRQILCDASPSNKTFGKMEKALVLENAATYFSTLSTLESLQKNPVSPATAYITGFMDSMQNARRILTDSDTPAAVVDRFEQVMSASFSRMQPYHAPAMPTGIPHPTYLPFLQRSLGMDSAAPAYSRFTDYSLSAPHSLIGSRLPPLSSHSSPTVRLPLTAPVPDPRAAALHSSPYLEYWRSNHGMDRPLFTSPVPQFVSPAVGGTPLGTLPSVTSRFPLTSLGPDAVSLGAPPLPGAPLMPLGARMMPHDALSTPLNAPTMSPYAPKMPWDAPNVSYGAPTYLPPPAPIVPPRPSTMPSVPTMSLGACTVLPGEPTIPPGAPTMPFSALMLPHSVPVISGSALTLTPGAPTVSLGAPTMPLNAPTMSLGAPTLRSSAPTMSLGAPTLMSSAPTMSLGAPTLRSSAPTMSLGAPTLMSSASTTSLNVPTLMTSAPTVSLSAPTLTHSMPTVSLSAPTLTHSAPMPTVSLSVPMLTSGAPTMSSSAPTLMPNSSTM